MTIQQDNNTEIKGFLLPAVTTIIDFISMKTATIFGVIKKGEQPKDAPDPKIARSIARRVDILNLTSLILGLALYICISSQIFGNLAIPLCIRLVATFLLIVLIVLRYSNIVSWQLRPLFVPARSQSPYKALSFERNLFYAFFQYVELIIHFGIIYALYQDLLNIPTGQKDSCSFLYFSAITQLTVGYGDIYPKGAMRLVCIIQAMTGLLIVALTIGSIIPHLHFSKSQTKQ